MLSMTYLLSVTIYTNDINIMVFDYDIGADLFSLTTRIIYDSVCMLCP